jgi:hypothetical protein
MNKVTFPLSRPIKAHNEDITALEFREPNGDDIADCGMPFAIEQKKGGGTLIHINTEAVAMYIVRLAGIPHSSYKTMAPVDITGSFGIIANFFGVSGTSQKPS